MIMERRLYKTLQWKLNIWKIYKIYWCHQDKRTRTLKFQLKLIKQSESMSDGIYMAEDLKKELLERKKVLNTHGVGLAAPTSHH